jgi:hypothetical protein
MGVAVGLDADAVDAASHGRAGLDDAQSLRVVDTCQWIARVTACGRRLCARGWRGRGGVGRRRER